MEKVDDKSIHWEEFKVSLLDLFFPFKLREEKIMELMNLKQGSMGVREYSLKCNNLSKYAPHLISNS